MHESVLVYRRYLYLKAAGLTAVAGLIAYIVHSPVGPANGGTWLGYILGGIGAALIVWLMWFGMRKRTYGAGHVKLEDWLSAHIYLGLALIFVATLHTGFQFSWNVHTLAYALMMVVIASGAFGVFAYIRYPRLMTQNRHGETLDGIMSEIAELDRECRNLSMTLTDEMSAAVLESSQNTRIGGSLLRQLSGRDPHCPTKAAFKTVRRLAGEATPKNADAARNLITLMGKKAFLVRRGRRDVQYKALMDVWLYIHIPLSFALLAALIAHIVSVFILWELYRKVPKRRIVSRHVVEESPYRSPRSAQIGPFFRLRRAVSIASCSLMWESPCQPLCQGLTTGRKSACGASSRLAQPLTSLPKLNLKRTLASTPRQRPWRGPSRVAARSGSRPRRNRRPDIE